MLGFTKKQIIFILASLLGMIAIFSVVHIIRVQSIGEDQYEEGFKNGQKKGYQKGYDDGYNDGTVFGQRSGYQSGYGDAQQSKTRCIHCGGRGVEACSMCNGAGCFHCDNTGVEACYFCKGAGVR